MGVDQNPGSAEGAAPARVRCLALADFLDEMMASEGTELSPPQDPWPVVLEVVPPTR